LEFFEVNQTNVFYLKQIEVKFEKLYFHWIIAKAVDNLIGSHIRQKRMSLWKGTPIKFLFHPKLRYHKRKIGKKLKIIRAFSDPQVTRAFGRQAEVLFFNALTNKGFLSHGQNINEYQGKKWTKTKHNLDFIIEKDNTTYGCEVKNTFDYIEQDELKWKIEICKYLNIKPLFIMRFSPKTYNWRIIQNNGCVIIFETQIYPFGFEDLVASIKEELELPVDCPRAIPDGIIQRFLKVHNKIKNV